MRQVILHIGTHKTGTTSVQSALQGFDDGKTIYSSLGENHSIAFFTAFSEAYQDYHYWRRLGLTDAEIDAKKAEFLAAMEAELSRKDRERLIYSGEDISSLAPDEKRALLKFLRRFDVDIKVICYVRNPSDYSIAILQQLIKQGKQRPGRIKMNYQFSLEAFAENLPPEKLTVKEYDRKKLYQGDIVADICREVGITKPLGEDQPKNVSLTADALKLMARFNTLPVRSSRSEELLRARNAYVDMIQEAYEGGEKLNPEYMSGRLICAPEELTFLKDRFGIDFRLPESTRPMDLAEHLSDLSDLDMAPLDNLLTENSIDAAVHETVDEKLVALYYAIVLRQKLRHDEAFREDVFAEHNEALRQIRETVAELEHYKADVLARRSKLAEWFDFFDYWLHLKISQLPFAPQRTRYKFKQAAKVRKRPKYSD